MSIFSRKAPPLNLPVFQKQSPALAPRQPELDPGPPPVKHPNGPGKYIGRAFGSKLVQRARKLNCFGAQADLDGPPSPTVKRDSADAAAKVVVADPALIEVRVSDGHDVVTAAPELVAAGESAAHPDTGRDTMMEVSAVTVSAVGDNVAAQTPPGVTVQNAAKAVKLQAELNRLQEWDSAHPVDLEKILSALTLVNEAHETKKPWNVRNKNYTKACQLMRQGMGIDDETYARAQKAFALQGVADAYDSGVFSFLLAPALAAVAGPLGSELGAAAGKVLKYATQWAIAPLANSVFQIPIDAFIETSARHDGVPVPAQDIANSPKMNSLGRQVKEQIVKANALIAIHEDVRRPAAERNAALDQLKECAAELDALHLGYTARVVLGQTNYINFATQIPFRILTAPAVVAATVFGGPLAGAGAAAAQQLTVAPFAAADEVLLKQHILRFNAKYANVLTDEAISAGKNRRSVNLQVEDLDEAKVKKLWTRPAQVIDANVQLVYTDELATRMRRQTKLDHVSRGGTGLTGKALEKAVQRADREQAKLVRLVDDVLNFRDRKWDQLDPEGTIAGMLLSPTKQVAALSKAKFRRPGEYTVQVLDRLGGQALPRTLVGIGTDSANLAQHAGAVADNGVAQAGGIGAAAYANPIAKFTKSRVMRSNMTPTPVDIPEAPADGARRAPIMRRSFGKQRPVTDGALQPKMSFGPDDNPLIIDFTQTRAWMNHTNSKAKIATQSATDTVKGLGTHIKAAATLPVRSAVGVQADHRAKQARARIARLVPVVEPQVPVPAPTGSATTPAAPAHGGALGAMLFEREPLGEINMDDMFATAAGATPKANG
ncbi:MAG: hypothetical protein V4754_09310 [Pseudomonadota bacterium]